MLWALDLPLAASWFCTSLLASIGHSWGTCIL